MDEAVLHECRALAFAGRITFPEVVTRMLDAGVERYHVDLTRMEQTHYGVDGGALVEPLSLADAPGVPAEFSADAVRAAISASQRREIDYPDFLRRIMAAGTAGYSTYLGGRKVIYFGRDGDFHVEPFPSR